jgi:hypothetical protein
MCYTMCAKEKCPACRQVHGTVVGRRECMNFKNNGACLKRFIWWIKARSEDTVSYDLLRCSHCNSKKCKKHCTGATLASRLNLYPITTPDRSAPQP